MRGPIGGPASATWGLETFILSTVNVVEDEHLFWIVVAHSHYDWQELMPHDLLILSGGYKGSKNDAVTKCYPGHPRLSNVPCIYISSCELCVHSAILLLVMDLSWFPANSVDGEHSSISLLLRPE